MRTTKEMNTNNVGASPVFAQKGITLIALVITIIVMLILVGVTISMAVNGGLFDYTGKAVGDTKNAINEEERLSNGAIKVDGVWYDSIDDYIKGKVALPEGIKVGDYVNYEPTAGEYKVSATVSGYTETTEQTFVTETGENALKWRVLSIDEETGKVELVSATVAQFSTPLYLQGANGYNHQVDILNDLCEALYSNENGATARSIKVEDINAKTTFDYTTYTDYGKVYTSSNKQYPSIYAVELGSTAYGLNETGNKLEASEGVRNSDGTADYKTYTGTSIIETLTATTTYYSYNAEEYLNTKLGVNTAPSGLIGVGKAYWVASRCVSAAPTGATWCLRCVYSTGLLTDYDIIGSGIGYPGQGAKSYTLRPVVSLKPNVALIKDVKNSTEDTTYWNIQFFS